MLTYAYECTRCGHTFDVFAKITAKPTSRKCPVCGARAKRQITGGAGFLFKGEGFYITDYRSEEYRSKEKAEKGSGGGDAEVGKPDARAGADGAAAASDKPMMKKKKKKKEG